MGGLSVAEWEGLETNEGGARGTTVFLEYFFKIYLFILSIIFLNYLF